MMPESTDPAAHLQSLVDLYLHGLRQYSGYCWGTPFLPCISNPQPHLQGIHVTAYSPLGTPDSKDMMKREETPSMMEEPAVTEIAEEHGKHPVQVGADLVAKAFLARISGLHGWRRSLVALDVAAKAQARWLLR